MSARPERIAMASVADSRGTLSPQEIDAAVRALRRGEPVVMPTETVYGLAVDALCPDAVRRVFALKGRPADNPLIVHVADERGLEAVCDRVPERARDLARAFWPGPLTLVVGRGAAVPDVVTGGRKTVAVRMPGHPVALALLQAFGGPLAAPSANRSGRVSPTSVAHAVSAMAGCGSELVTLDGGPCAVGLESTVIDLTTDPPRILRPGSITSRALSEVVGSVLDAPVTCQSASPGTALRHYAPDHPAFLIDPVDIPAYVEAADMPVALLARTAPAVHPPHYCIIMPHDPESYAQRLYAALREADELPVARICIESVPWPDADPEGRWHAVRDRLARATAREHD